MIWSSEVPSEPGAYWVRRDGYLDVIFLRPDGAILITGGEGDFETRESFSTYGYEYLFAASIPEGNWK